MSPGFLTIAQSQESTSSQNALAALEASAHGRIGVAAINTENNKRVDYRAEEQFPFQSTFKVMGVAAILKQSMTDSSLLQQKITYSQSDITVWSPITEKHILDGMMISELCAAAIMFSDNTAINLLIKKLGGPEAVTSFARSFGDNTFRLESWEANLNSNPKDQRDTSTPAAMQKSLQQLTLGNALALSQREQLITWMKGNTTGDARIRAGVPKGWVVADKTGSGDYGITNDIGIIWPPHGAPIIIALFFIQDQKEALRRDDVIAFATKIALKALTQGN